MRLPLVTYLATLIVRRAIAVVKFWKTPQLASSQTGQPAMIGSILLLDRSSNGNEMFGAPLFHLRGAGLADANELFDIDMKCFQDAWTPEDWGDLLHSGVHGISVVTYFGVCVGAVVFSRVDNSVHILKLAVKVTHRKAQVSRMLLRAVVTFAHSKGVSRLFFIVPESMIYPGPTYMAQWALKVGFICELPFVRNQFPGYGDAEDGVRFVSHIAI